MAVNYLVVIASKTVDLDPFGPFVEGLGLKFVKFVALVALVQEPQSSAAMAINSGFLDSARDGKTRLSLIMNEVQELLVVKAFLLRRKV